MAKKTTTWRSKSTGKELLEMFCNEESVCVFDTETTGLDSKTDRVIQISGIKLDTKSMDEISRLDIFINPERPLPPKITEITGITDEMLADKPTEAEAFSNIHSFFGDSPAIIAYNEGFDERFMKSLYERNGKTFSPVATSDALEMSRDIVKKGETSDYKLGTIAHHFGVDKGITFHNSMDDVVATTRLLRIFKGEYEERFANEEEVLLVAPKKVFSIRFWEGYRGCSRLYINTDIGSFYFDIRSKVWGTKADNPYSLEEVDMETLRELSFKFAGVTNESDFSKFRA